LPRSGCPINATIEVFGDRWSLNGDRSGDDVDGLAGVLADQFEFATVVPQVVHARTIVHGGKRDAPELGDPQLTYVLRQEAGAV
jgi:hypothetical protein